jgi:hypothetical protein
MIGVHLLCQLKQLLTIQLPILIAIEAHRFIDHRLGRLTICCMTGPAVVR